MRFSFKMNILTKIFVFDAFGIFLNSAHFLMPGLQYNELNYVEILRLFRGSRIISSHICYIFLIVYENSVMTLIENFVILFFNNISKNGRTRMTP